MGRAHRGWAIVAALAFLTAVAGGGLRGAEMPAAKSAPPFIIDVWQNDDGLPENVVLSQVQTKDGHLWLATLNGLARFDGIRFTVFDEVNTPGLNSSRIIKLFEDSRGRLWIGTSKAGVALVEQGRVNSFKIGQGGNPGSLFGICEDDTGKVWMYSADRLLWYYQDGKLNPFHLRAPGGVDFRSLIAEKGGPVWLGTTKGQYGISVVDSSLLSDEADLRLRVANRLDFLLASASGGYWRLADGVVQRRWTSNRMETVWGPAPWSHTAVSAACEDREGNLVVGTLGAGIFWLGTNGQVTAISTNEGLSNNYILSLHVDREGSLWVGTDGGGLNRVRHTVFGVVPESQGLTVRSVCEDNAGGVWFGSNNRGIGHWKNGKVERFDTPWSVTSMFVDHRDNVWIGTYGAIMHFQGGSITPSGTTTPIVSAIHQDRKKQLWVGTLTNGLELWSPQQSLIFTKKAGLSSDEVRAIADDRQGNLWIGTDGGGLNRLRDGKFTAYHKADGLPSEDISSLLVDDDDVLWVGTFGSGLARFDGTNWARYTTREGLYSNSIGHLLDDGQGNLWIGSNEGLMRISKDSLNSFARGHLQAINCRVYQKADGLLTKECTIGSQPGSCRTRDGHLWFSTINGLVTVDPAQIKENPYPPPVVIESVFVENQLQNTNALGAGLPPTITLSPKRERLEIHFSSLNLAAPEKARFKFRLEEHEDWSLPGTIRVARYSKLPPGNYRFQVTACNEDGVWNPEGQTLAVIVRPPYWRTWWFLTVTVLCLLGVIVAIVYSISTQRLQRQLAGLQQQEALEHERARIARDIHDQLGANLTQVALLGEMVQSDKNEPAEVASHAQQICQTARDTTRALDEIVWTVNPSNDTLDGLVNYICKYAQDYLGVAGLRYRLDIPAQLPAAPITPEVRHHVFLAAKEAVNNVVKHARATAASIHLRLEPRTFTLEIEDNGRGLAGLDEKAAQARNGLRNMRKRMEDIGGRFEIRPGAEGGTCVQLTVPIANHT